MESTLQKTFTKFRAQLSLAAVLAFVQLIYSALSAVGKDKGVRVTDGDTIKVVKNGRASNIRLVGIDAPETSMKKIEADQPFSQKSTKHLNDRYWRTLGGFIGW